MIIKGISVKERTFHTVRQSRPSYLAARFAIYHAEIACRYHSTSLFTIEMNLEEVLGWVMHLIPVWSWQRIKQNHLRDSFLVRPYTMETRKVKSSFR